MDRPGAVAAGGRDAAVAGHYGDPAREARAVADSLAIVDLGMRDVLSVGGSDRLSWLHSLTSQHLLNLVPGQATEALILTPHGHIEWHLRLVDDGSRTWIDTEPGDGQGLLEHLARMRFMLDVDPRPEPELTVLALVGPRAADRIGADGRLVGLGSSAAPDVQLQVRWPAPRVDLIGTDTEIRRWADELQGAGATVVGLDALEAHRVAARIARVGLDTDHRTLAHEVGVIGHAVHLDKGCYRGQETVARIENLGAPPRRLVLLHLDGSLIDLPATGDDIIEASTGRTVGRVGTVARHAELGPVALALVRRQLPVSSELHAGPVSALIDRDDPPPAPRQRPQRPPVIGRD